MDEDDRYAKQGDSDRAAILARRRRFIALAISGLATAGCKQSGPEPCLSIAPDSGSPDPQDPEATTGEPATPGPFVEDPGAPLENDETGETGGDEPDTTKPLPPDTRPDVCLKMVAPQPCLRKPKPRTCLLMID